MNADDLYGKTIEISSIMNDHMRLSLEKERLMKPGEKYISILIRKEENSKEIRIDLDTPARPGRSCTVAKFENRKEAVEWLQNQISEKVQSENIIG